MKMPTLVLPLQGIVTLELILAPIIAFPSEEHLKFSVARVGYTDFPLDCPIVQPNVQSVLWLLPHDHFQLIGPSGQYDHNKYGYLASSGQLLIKDVTYEDAGIYRCILKIGDGPGDLEPETSAVQLEVKPSFINVWETQLDDNLIRGSIAGGIFMAVLLSICLFYKLRYKVPPYKKYLSSFDSGVPVPIGSRRGTSASVGSSKDVEESGKVSPAPRRLSMVRGEILVQPGRRESAASRRASKDSQSQYMRRLSHLAALEYRRSSQVPQTHQLNVLRPDFETRGATSAQKDGNAGAEVVGNADSTARKDVSTGSTVVYVTKE